MIILLCFIASFIKVCSHELPWSHLLEETGLYFLYTIGYGSLEQDTVLQQVFAMIGIISLSLMGTFLTINLFWRIDDVKIRPTIEWKKEKEHSYLTFEIQNKGRSICDLKATFMTYDASGNLIAQNLEEYTYPLLVHGAKWIMTMNLKETFWYQTLKTMLENDQVSLYMTFSLVDVKTGQSSIKVVSWKVKDLVSDELETLTLNIKNPIIHLPLEKLQVVGYQSVVQKLDDAGMSYEFSKKKDSFAMLYFSYHDEKENWNRYDANKTNFCFEIDSMKEAIVTIELKGNGTILKKNIS